MAIEPDVNARRAVLVGTDGSPTVVDALTLAHAVAAPLRAAIESVCVHTAAGAGASASEAALRRVAETTSAQMQAAGLPYAPGRRLREVTGESGAAGLAAAAAALQAELIVVGSSAGGRLGRIHPGATGRRLLARTPCPVAVAPRGYAATPAPLSPVGVAHDGSPEAERALAWAAAFARAAGAELRVLTVHTALAFGHAPVGPGLDWAMANDAWHHQRRDALGRSAAAFGGKAALLDGDPATELLAQSSDLGLLVAGSRSHGRFASLPLGSVASALVDGAPCPVVISPRFLAR